MPELPPIRQKVIVDVEGDRAAAQKIGGVADATDDLTEAQDRNAKSAHVLTGEQRKLLDARVQAGRQQRGFIRQHQLEKAEVDRTARAHGLLGRALASNNDEQRKQTGELKKLTSGFKAAGSAAQLFALYIGIVKWPAIAAGIGLATSAVNALAAGVIALVGTLGPLLNLAGLIPAALAAAAGGIGAALIGTRGVGEAIGAGFAKPGPKAAGKDPVDQARKQEDALRGVERAQESLSDSQRDATRAQEDLNKAWLDARNNLRDLREEQTRGTNSVARAEIALTRARERQKELTEDDEATAEDRREALIDISDAELDLLDAQQRRTSNARDLAEAEAKGVAGSDAVTEAQERVADSQQAVIDNTLELKRAIEDVGRSMKDTGTAEVNKFADAMAELGPEAREFVNTLVGQKSAFKQIKRDVSESLFGPINDGMKTLLGNAPAFTSFLTSSAAGVGNIGKALLQAFGDKGIGEDFRKLGEGNKALFDSIAKGMKPLVKIFTDLAVVGQPFLKAIVDLAVGGIGKLSDKIAAMRKDGSLADFFQRGLDTAKIFGRILRDLTVGLGNVFKAAKPLGDDLLKSFGDLIKRFRDFTGSVTGQNKMADFFESQKPILHEIAILIGDIAGVWFRLSQANTGPLTDFIQRLRVEALPILEQLLTSVGPAFINNILDLALALGNLFSTLFGESGPMSVFLQTFTAIFEVITDLINSVPGLKNFVFAILAITAAFKALSLVGKLTGITGFIGLLTDPKTKAVLFGSGPFAQGIGVIPGIISAIGAAATAAGGGVLGLVTVLGSIAVVAAPLILIGATIAKAWFNAKKRADELKKTSNDLRAALSDDALSVEQAVAQAVSKRITSKNQEDDLKRVGVSVGEIANAALKGGEAIDDVRRKLVESGEVQAKARFGMDDTAEAIERVEEAYIKTGKVADGYKLTNEGLVHTLEDVDKATEAVAEEQIKLMVQQGQITPQLQAQATLWDLQEQGILNFIANGPRHGEQLDFIKGKISDQNRARERSIELIDQYNRKLAGITSVATATVDRDRANRSAFDSAQKLATAQAKVDDLRRRGKLDTDAGREAQEELTSAHEDAILAADAYASAQVEVARAEADLSGKTFGASEAAHAQAEAFKALNAVIGPTSPLSADLNTLIGQLDAAFTDRSMTVTVQATGLFSITDAFRAAVQQGVQGGLLAGIGLGGAAPPKPTGPATTNPFVVTAQAKAQTARTRSANAAEGPLSARQAANAGIANPTFEEKEALSREAQLGYDQLSTQDKLLIDQYRKRSGFAVGGITTGEAVLVGEGNPAFPEFVIPTDPAYRENALGLIRELVKRLGGGAFQGGVLGLDTDAIARTVMRYNQQQEAAQNAQMAGRAFQLARRNARKSPEGMQIAMFAAQRARDAFMRSRALAGDGGMGDFGGMRIMAGQMDMGGTSRTITQGDTITGDHIGTSIGNEWRFEEGAIQVKDWEGAKAQLARDERLRNMTRAAGARSR